MAVNIIHVWPDLSMTLLEARRDGSSDCFGARFSVGKQQAEPESFTKM
jgi:hypothetical protein